MPEQTFGSPAQLKLKELQEKFGGHSFEVKMRDSKDVAEFLTKKREWEERTKQQPEMKFK